MQSEKGRAIQWPKEKGQTAQKTKDRTTRTRIKNRDELSASKG